MSKQWFDERLYEMKQDRDRLAAENAELARVLEQIVVAHVRLIQAIDEHEQNDPESMLEVSEARAALTKVKMK